ncbi:MAG: neutral zinc metallopeptidase [Sphingomonadaceae bacterium]
MRLDDLDDGNLDSDVNANYQRGGRGGFGFPGGGSALGGRSLGCGGIVVLLVAALIFGVNPSDLVGGGQVAPSAQVQQAGAGQTGDANAVCQSNQATRFSCLVLKSTNLTWEKEFTDGGYRKPRIEFYDRNGQSGCGAAQSAMGPFYCPADESIYIDTTFYDELAQRFGAAGDFAQAYVIAHEVGHHLQKLTGIADKVQQAQASASKVQGNQLQVAMELQADCYAGVWAAKNAQRMDPGDVEEGLRAAHQIGDDVLQRASQGVVVEAAFTHGSAAQRMEWLKRGLQSGNPDQCNTFGR